MSGHVTATAHADIDDLTAVRLAWPMDLVAIRAGDLTLFLADGDRGKDAVLRCIDRLAAQVQALPDHHTAEDGAP